MFRTKFLGSLKDFVVICRNDMKENHFNLWTVTLLFRKIQTQAFLI